MFTMASERASCAAASRIAGCATDSRSLPTVEQVTNWRITPKLPSRVTVLESGEVLMTIINEILDFSKIDAGKIELDIAPFDLREVVGDMMKSLALRAHHKNLELAWRADPEIPQCIIGDAARLRQILVNLAGNAIKFTEQGEVLLDIQCRSNNGKYVDIGFRIRDTGIGIAEDKLNAIFEKFEQADPSTTRRFGGTGLGLAIASRLGELMGGKIEVESKLGEGTNFFFTLPFETAPDPENPEIGRAHV